VEIIVEVRLIRRDPIEVPIHLLAYHFDLIERGHGLSPHTTCRDEQNVSVAELRGQPREHPGLPILMGSHHEVFDKYLTAAFEQVRQADFALARIEEMLLFALYER
jgi:hypothetical protein